MKRGERPCEEHFVVFPSVGAITKFHCSFLVSGSRGGQRHAFTPRFDFPSLPFVHVARELIRRRAEIKLNSLTENAKRERERDVDNQRYFLHVENFQIQIRLCFEASAHPSKLLKVRKLLVVFDVMCHCLQLEERNRKAISRHNDELYQAF